jgi:APA family basic amino acid/polyamine antiporter
MSKDGLLPSFFSDILKIQNSMENKSFLHGICSLLSFRTVSDLGHMVSIGTLLAFVLGMYRVLVMRKKKCR